MSIFDMVEDGQIQSWYISMPFATVNVKTVQEGSGNKRITDIAPIFRKGFEGKKFTQFVDWIIDKAGKEHVKIEEL